MIFVDSRYWEMLCGQMSSSFGTLSTYEYCCLLHAMPVINSHIDFGVIEVICFLKLPLLTVKSRGRVLNSVTTILYRNINVIVYLLPLCVNWNSSTVCLNQTALFCYLNNLGHAHLYFFYSNSTSLHFIKGQKVR